MSSEIDHAVRCLEAGGVVAFPTETVYGLGADARSEAAVARVFAIKGRPAEHPLIVHLADAAWLDAWAEHIPEDARRLAARFWPGPLTLILMRQRNVLDAVTGGQGTIAVRVPGHPLALELLRAFGHGLAAPSANRFGNVSPTSAAHVRAELGDAVDVVLDGGPCDVGVESTIVDLSADAPRILRPGGVSREAIEETLGRRVAVGVSDMVRAPGTLPSHYAPRARIELLEPSEISARAAALRAEGTRVAVLSERADSFAEEHIDLPTEAAARARRLYAALRELDDRGFEVGLVVRDAREEGLHLAISDRLTRAAAPERHTDDSKARFSATVDDYVRYRPDYPAALFEWIEREANLDPGDLVVDVGCGTGISTRQLAARGWRLIGVDPNRDMLRAAKDAGGEITYLEGDAEDLDLTSAGVVAGDVAAITGAQAFHWFDLSRALPRFRSLLRPGGRIIAFFNLREGSTAAMRAYDDVLRRFSPEYEEVGAESRAKKLASSSELIDLSRIDVPHAQSFDREGLSGRAWSSSYVRRDVRDRVAFERALDEIFDAHAVSGRFTFTYDTVGLSFR